MWNRTSSRAMAPWKWLKASRKIQSSMSSALIINDTFLARISRANLSSICAITKHSVDLGTSSGMPAIGWHARIILQGEYICSKSHNSHNELTDNYRNTDKKRRERLAMNRAMGKRSEPRKQIKVVSTSKETGRTFFGAQYMSWRTWVCDYTGTQLSHTI